MIRRPTLLIAALLVAAFALVPRAALAAAPGVDPRGTWAEVTAGSVNSTITITAFDCATGSFSGSGVTGNITWAYKGTIDGMHLLADAGPYVYGNSGTPSGYHYFPDMTFSDSSHASGFFPQGGKLPITWSRLSGPPSTGGCTGEPLPDPTTPDPTTPGATTPPAPDERHPTQLQVMCTYVVATSLDTCTATVGDGAGQPTSPTGTVTFAKTEGSFFGDTCQLSSSPSAPSTGFCAVTYQRPFGSTKFPEISASYGGDATHGASLGSTTFLILGGPVSFNNTYPNQVDFQTTVEADGTEVEVCATVASGGSGKASRLQSPDPTAPIDPAVQALADIARKIQEADARQTQILLPIVDKNLEKAKDMMNKAAAEYAAKVNSKLPADQKRVQQLGVELDKLKGAINSMRDAMSAGCRSANGSRAVFASAASAKKKKAKSTVLATFKTKSAKAGPLAVSLKFKKSALKKVRKGQQPLTVYVRIRTSTPSGLTKKGWPRLTIQTLKLGADGKLVS